MKFKMFITTVCAASLLTAGIASAATTAAFKLVPSANTAVITATGSYGETDPTTGIRTDYPAEGSFVVTFSPTPTKDTYSFASGTYSYFAAFWENQRPVVHGSVTVRNFDGTVRTSFSYQWNGYMEWSQSMDSNPDYPWSSYNLFMETRSGTSGSGPLFSEARMELNGSASATSGLPPQGNVNISAYGHDAAQRSLWMAGSYTLTNGKTSTKDTFVSKFHQVRGQLPTFTMVDTAMPVSMDLAGSFTERLADGEMATYPVRAVMTATLSPAPSRDGRYERWEWDNGDGTMAYDERYNFWTSHRTTFTGTVVIEKPEGPVTFDLTTHSNLSSGYNTYHNCPDYWSEPGYNRCDNWYTEASYDYFIPTVETGAGAPDFVNGGGWIGGYVPYVTSSTIPKLAPSGSVYFDFRGPGDWGASFTMHLEGTYTSR